MSLLLKQTSNVPENFILWQHFLTQPKTRQNLALYGNLGVTVLMIVIAVIALFSPYRLFISSVLIVALSVFFIMDIIAYREPRKLGKLWAEKDFDF